MGGVDVYYRRSQLTRAALHVRRHGPACLRYLSVSDIWGMLQKFIRDNYLHLARETFGASFDGSYSEHVSPSEGLLAETLAASSIFQPIDQLTLFPLVPVRVTADFDAGPFCLVAPASLPSCCQTYLHPRMCCRNRFRRSLIGKGAGNCQAHG